MGLVKEAAEGGGHLVLEMPTGTGKTVVLLAGAVEAAQRTGKRILYVSRTNSQQEHTLHELNQIRARHGLPLRAVALQGRTRLCTKLDETGDPEWGEASPEELGHYCSHAKSITDKEPESPRGCRFWAGLQRRTTEELEALLGPEPRSAEWMRRLGRDAGFCPYEANKRLLPKADVVVAPYVFALDAGLRRRLTEWWGCEEKDIVLIVDEAHNVPAYVREMHSPRLTREGLRRALAEAKELGDPEILRGHRAQPFLETIAIALGRLVEEYCKEEDGFVPPFEFETMLLDRFATTTRALAEAAGALAALGEVVKDRRRVAGRIPRSHLSHVAGFLQRWGESEDNAFVRLVGREPGPYLEAFMVDARIAVETFQRFHATIHASGTLDPLEEYRDSLGLPEETRLERFPSPFPPEHLLLRSIGGVTTRHEALKEDPRAVDRLQDAVARIVATARVNTALFFPSHRLLEEFREVGVWQGHGEGALVESRDVAQDRLMELLARQKQRPDGGLLVGVLGGRLSEGLDFPGRALEAAIIVGVPYPKPTAHQRALFHYHEVRQGRGWDYTVRAPALRRLRQALGRMIRSGEDHGFAIVVDDRAGPLLRSAGLDCTTVSLDEVVAEFTVWQAQRRPIAAPRTP